MTGPICTTPVSTSCLCSFAVPFGLNLFIAQNCAWSYTGISVSVTCSGTTYNYTGGKLWMTYGEYFDAFLGVNVWFVFASLEIDNMAYYFGYQQLTEPACSDLLGFVLSFYGNCPIGGDCSPVVNCDFTAATLTLSAP